MRLGFKEFPYGSANTAAPALLTGCAFTAWRISDLASEEATGYPASNLRRWNYLFPWRSVDTNAGYIQIDTGANPARTNLFVYFEDANFTGVSLYRANTPTYPGTLITSITLATHVRTGRRHGVAFNSGTTSNNRYLFVAYSGLDAGATYYQLGTMTVGQYVDLADDPALPFGWTAALPSERADLPAGILVNSLGPPRRRCRLANDHWLASTMPYFRDYVAQGAGAPIIFWQYDISIHQAQLLKLVSAEVPLDEGIAYGAASLDLEEP